MRKSKQLQWLGVTGGSVALKQDKENAINGKKKGSVREETNAVSGTTVLSVQKWHRKPLHLLSHQHQAWGLVLVLGTGFCPLVLGVDAALLSLGIPLLLILKRVDRGALDSVLSSLGLPGWFRHAYFEIHSSVRLRFKLATGLGWASLGPGDGGIPQGCPLSMMFYVGVGIWERRRGFSLNCMLTISSVFLGILGSFCVLRALLLGMLGLLVRSLLQESACLWALLGLFVVLCGDGLFLMRVTGGLSSWMFGILGVILILLLMVRPLPWLLGFALSLLGWFWRLRFLRSMFIPGALHGIEASFLAGTGMRKGCHF